MKEWIKVYQKLEKVLDHPDNKASHHKMLDDYFHLAMNRIYKTYDGLFPMMEHGKLFDKLLEIKKKKD